MLPVSAASWTVGCPECFSACHLSTSPRGSGSYHFSVPLTYLGRWTSNDPDEQVIAPFLLVLRIANRTTLTDEGTVSGNLDSIRFNSMGGSTGVDRTIPDGNPIDSTLDVHGETPGEYTVGEEGIIEETAS